MITILSALLGLEITVLKACTWHKWYSDKGGHSFLLTSAKLIGLQQGKWRTICTLVGKKDDRLFTKLSKALRDIKASCRIFAVDLNLLRKYSQQVFMGVKVVDDY